MGSLCNSALAEETLLMEESHICSSFEMTDFSVALLPDAHLVAVKRFFYIFKYFNYTVFSLTGNQEGFLGRKIIFKKMSDLSKIWFLELCSLPYICNARL